MHTAWLAVLYTCAAVGALFLTGVALLAREVRKAGKPPPPPDRGPVTDEEIEAALRDWAGEAL